MILVRKPTEAEIEVIARISRRTREHNLPYLPKLHTAEEDLKYFKERVFTEDRLIVAEENRKIVGFCAFKDGWVNHLYVLPVYQGRGVGRALLDKAKGAYPNLKLWVFQKNTKAREFYEKNGFVLKIITPFFSILLMFKPAKNQGFPVELP